MNSAEIGGAVESLAAQMVSDLPDLMNVSIAGVVSRGAVLAMRLRELIERQGGIRLPCASVDVHRDSNEVSPLDGSEAFEVEGRTIVLVDDVINSGWTVQHAMDALWKQGRPAAVKLAVLIDRGHRAVPIRPNYVGKNIPTSRTERVRVRLGDPDSTERVVLYSMVDSTKEGAAGIDHNEPHTIVKAEH
jgi:pyrimidine operon attenuation protein/uracil phosphoribosyltransferase